MRLPKIEQPDGTKIIDQDKTNEMVAYAIDHGVNYFDTAYVYGGSEEAMGKALACVIMEPLRGGAMVTSVPTSVRESIEAFPVRRPPVEWAFRWLYDMPESKVILSGVSSLEQLEQDNEIFANAEAGSMSPHEHELIDTIKDACKEGQKIGCTRCGYCLPCPQGVDIPEVFQLWNDMAMESYQGHCRFQYTRMVHAMGNGATECIECGICEGKCPQELPIIESLKEAHEELLNPQLV
jgi:hypothetical protein